MQPATKTPASPKSQEELTKKENELAQALSQAKQEELAIKTPETHTLAEQKIALLSRQVQEVHLQKRQLELELATLQKQLASQRAPIVHSPKPAATTQTVQDPQHVRVIPQSVTKKAGL